MSDLDYLNLDGRALRVFLMVVEEGSVSRAAERLDVTQSAVSHTLDKLRTILGDPLFVRSGRGIQATARASALREPAQAALEGLRELTNEREFDPKTERMEFTIAANDFQRELLFPVLLRELYAEHIDARFRFLAGGAAAANLLHEARCQFIVTPFLPDGEDILQLTLFQDQVVCFYDGSKRGPPETQQDFYESEYADVVFSDYWSATSALNRQIRSKLGSPRITVPNFNDLRTMMEGTTLITAQLGTMALNVLSELDWAPLPFENDPIGLYLVWHRRDHADPAHKWLRRRITHQAKLVAASLTQIYR